MSWAQPPEFEHLERLEQVAIHVDDLEATMAIFEDLGVRFLPVMSTVIGGDAFRLVVSTVGISLVETKPPGLRAVGFKTRDLAGVKKKLSARGIEPVLEFSIEGYSEAHFVIDKVRYSLAEYPANAPTRMVAAVVAGLVHPHPAEVQ